MFTHNLGVVNCDVNKILSTFTKNVVSIHVYTKSGRKTLKAPENWNSIVENSLTLFSGICVQRCCISSWDYKKPYALIRVNNFYRHRKMSSLYGESGVVFKVNLSLFQRSVTMDTTWRARPFTLKYRNNASPVLMRVPYRVANVDQGHSTTTGFSPSNIRECVIFVENFFFEFSSAACTHRNETIGLLSISQWLIT